MNEPDKILKFPEDETRYKILLLLSLRPTCIRGIAKILNISEPGITQHLRALDEAGLITRKKVGPYTHYRINKSRLPEIIDISRKLPCSTENLVKQLKALNVVSTDCTKVCKKNKNQ